MNANEMVERAEFLSQQYDTEGRYQMGTGTSGCTRTVRIEGEYAFKAVWRAKNAGNNRSEWDFYVMTTDEIRAKLAKPLYISRNGNVIVMEVVTQWRERIDNYNAKYGSLEKHTAALDKLTYDTYRFGIGDFHGGNWGITASGAVVLLDYGAMEWHAQRHEHEKMKRQGCEPVYHRDYMVDLLLTSANN